MRLTGEQFDLELLEEEHTDSLFEIASEPSNWTYMTRKMHNKHDMRLIVEEALKLQQQGDTMPFIVKRKKDGAIVGSTRLYDISPQRKTAEIGSTYYSESVRSTGVNTECKYLLLTYAFETLGVVRVQFKTDEQNKAARKAIQKLGAFEEGILRNERKLPDGRVRNAAVYSIIKEEWPEVKAKLTERIEIKKKGHE